MSDSCTYPTEQIAWTLCYLGMVGIENTLIRSNVDSMRNKSPTCCSEFLDNEDDSKVTRIKNVILTGRLATGLGRAGW